MSTGLKVVLWIAGGIAALLVLLVVAGFFFGRSVMDDAQEGSAFAANATHDDCVAELSKRLNGCDGLNCILQNSVFGGTCLGGAKGDRDLFCDGVPGPTDQSAMATWKPEFCTKQELAKENCELAAGIVAGFCSSDPPK